MRSVMSVSFPEQISHELVSYAAETGRSKSDIIKESVALYIWDFQFNSLKKNMMRRAKKVGILTEDDVFTAIS